MSGRQIGTVIGGVIGFFAGGNVALGASIGGVLGGAISPDKVAAPSIGDAQQQTSQAGMPIPKVFGHSPPIAPTLIDGDKIARKTYHDEQQGKGGGPVTEDVEGFVATRAFLVCEGPIQGFARIYRNGKLVYSTISGDSLDADSAAWAAQVSFYYGTETQGPDPSLEALHGVGQTPYYRGRAYFVVRDDNETDTRGAANQYRVEVIAAGATTQECYDYEGAAFYWPLDDVASGVAAELIQGKDGEYSASASASGAIRAGSSGSMNLPDRAQYFRADYNDLFRVNTNAFGGWTVMVWGGPSDQPGGSVQKTIARCSSGAFSGQHAWSIHLGGANEMTPTATWNTSLESIQDSVEMAENEIAFFALTYQNTGGTSGTFKFYKNGALIGSLDTTALPNGPGNTIFVGDPFFPSSGGLAGTVSDLVIYERALTAAEIAEKYTTQDSYFQLPDLPGAYVNREGNVVGICRETISGSSSTWADIVNEIASRCNSMLPDHLDIAHMTDVVPGFVLGNPGLTGADYIRTLCTFGADKVTDLVEYDDELHAIRRGAAVAGTLDPDDLYAIEDDDDDLRGQAIEAPARVTLMYPDPANNYVTTPQSAPRFSPDVSAASEVNIECPIPFSADQMIRKADIMQKIFFLPLEGKIKRAFPAEYDKYVQSDPVMFNDRRYLITSKASDDIMVQFEATYDRASAYTSTMTGTNAPTPTGQTSNLKGPTILAAMNLPSLRSQDNVPGIYVAVRGILSGWPGCDFQISYDGGVSYPHVVRMTRQATIGLLVDDITASSEPITVNVYGTDVLETVTTDQIAAGANAFAIITSDVCEIGQFRTAAENSDGDYDLTNVTRAQLETTAAAHSAGDKFVMLDTDLYFVPIDIKYAGTTLYLRPVTLGTAAANNEAYTFTFSPLFTSVIVGTITDANGNAITVDGNPIYTVTN